MSDQLKYLNSQIASLEASIVPKIASLEAAQGRWDELESRSVLRSGAILER